MVESILRNEPEVDRARLERTRQLMCEAVRDCIVTGYERLCDGFELPDPRTATSSPPPVTSNLSDFPTENLDAYSIEAQSPDQFVLHLIDLAPAAVAAVVAQQADALRNPPQTLADLLDRLSRNGLPEPLPPCESTWPRRALTGCWASSEGKSWGEDAPTGGIFDPMEKLNRLKVEVAAGRSADYPNVVLLVDGRDALGETGRMGFDPEDMFDEEEPLLPGNPPRRVALYRCGCGEAGCGSAACLISERDGVIRWSDFRDYVGVFARPLTRSAPENGRRLDLPEFSFDAEQYRAEVRRARSDRSWETRRRRMARLLKERLGAQPQRWRDLGFEFLSVRPWNDASTFAVDLRSQSGQLLVGVSADDLHDDEAVADRMATEVFDGDRQTWLVLYDQSAPR